MLQRVLLSVPSRALSCRTFVSSSVTLSKRWDNETVADIKDELKKRGLSQTGNKAALISRISEYDRRKQSEPSSPQDQIRHASTGSAPGRPEVITSSLPADFLATRLPDLSQPLQENPVQIPFTPDHWESSRIKPSVDTTDVSDPKFLTVSLPATLVGGGPSHNLYSMSDEAPSPTAESKTPGGGFWSDVVTDLGLPTSIKIPTVQWRFSERPTASTNKTNTYSRKLEPDEVRGVWVLLGLVAGSWILGGVTRPVSKVEAK